MIWIINILAFLLLSGMIAFCCQKKTVALMPLIYSCLMIVLYALAFFRRMAWIDAVAAAVIVGAAAWITAKKAWKGVFQQFIQPSFLVFLLVAVVGVWLLSDRAFSTFDEFNFWAVDAKSMYALGGFAEKGLNCSFAYGDYPPVPSIAGWWLLHMAGHWDEGLTIAGQYLAIAMYLAPLFGKLPDSKRVWLLCLPWVCTFSAFGAVIYANRSPDVLMGICYGSALIAILEYSKSRDLCELAGICSILAVLVQIKSVGIEWAVFALLFMLLLLTRTGWKQTLLAAAFPAVSYLSWSRFCAVMGRSTYLVTGYLSQQEVGISEEMRQWQLPLAKEFLRTWFLPLNTPSHFGGLCLSLAAILLIFSVLAISSDRLWPKEQPHYGVKTGAYIILTGIVEGAILLYSVETMFLAEAANFMQNMLLVFKRYGAPFTVGSYMLVLWIFFEFLPKLAERFCQNGSPRTWAVRAASFIMCLGILSCSLVTQYDLFIGYRLTGVGRESGDGVPSHDTSETSEIVFQTIQRLMKTEGLGKDRIAFAALPGAGDLGLYTTPYYCAPVPTANIAIYEGWSTQDMINSMRYYGCSMLCILSGQTTAPVFSTADGNSYRCDTIYEIVETEAGPTLVAFGETSK